MKQKTTKGMKIYLVLTVLVLLFLLGVNVTFSYFSAVKEIKTNDSLKMGSLDLGWAIQIGDQTTRLTTKTEPVYNVIPVLPAGDTDGLSRGDSFTFKYEIGGNQYSNNVLGLSSASGSADAYVRVWVEAYVYVDGEIDTTTNYGRYFELDLVEVADDDQRKVYIEEKERTENSIVVETNKIYYLNKEIQANAFRAFITGMTISSSTPLEILEKPLAITINFGGVQAQNKAHEALFGDWMGYGSNWE